MDIAGDTIGKGFAGVPETCMHAPACLVCSKGACRSGCSAAPGCRQYQALGPRPGAHDTWVEVTPAAGVHWRKRHPVTRVPWQENAWAPGGRAGQDPPARGADSTCLSSRQVCMFRHATRLACVQVLKLFPEERVMVVKGSIPGKKGNFVEIVPASAPRSCAACPGTVQVAALSCVRALQRRLASTCPATELMLSFNDLLAGCGGKRQPHGAWHSFKGCRPLCASSEAGRAQQLHITACCSYQGRDQQRQLQEPSGHLLQMPRGRQLPMGCEGLEVCGDPLGADFAPRPVRS